MQCINSGGLPFTPTAKIPNAQTLAALDDEDDNNVVYRNVEELSSLWEVL